MLNFQWPWVFAALPLPALIYFFMPPVNQAEAALRVPFFSAIGHASGALKAHKRRIARILLLSLIWILLVFASARPQWLGEPMPLQANGRDLMLAVDISGSMQTEDMRLQDQMVNRLQGIKLVLDGFIQRRPQDRLGLILFGSNAYIQAPLTFDHDTLGQFLEDAQIGFAGQETAIGDAIGLAIKRMQERPEQSRVMVLLTDGANTAGAVDPLDAAKMAASQSIKIYTLGFGADEMIVKGFFGNRRVNPSQDLDEDSLKAIADVTGGRYFRARNIEELVQIYQLLDQLEPSAQEGQVAHPQKALFFWPLAAALLLSLIWAIVPLLTPLVAQRAQKA